MKTDSQLQQDVTAELSWDPTVDAARIGVSVTDGIVSLSGTVNSFAGKWHAERAAQRVAGVTGLAVEVEVKLPGTDVRDDADIARTARNALDWMSQVPRDSVKVLVENGWITLSGTVDWRFQRQAAAGAVRYLMGATGVSDQIVVKPAAAAAVSKSSIESALRRSARGGAHQIHVDVQGGEVTLSGQVNSWGEREAAADTAWRTPGVHNVVDRIQVIH